jgi:hypothetical protein
MTNSGEKDLLSQGIVSDESLDEFNELSLDRKLSMIYLTMFQISYDVELIKDELGLPSLIPKDDDE